MENERQQKTRLAENLDFKPKYRTELEGFEPSDDGVKVEKASLQLV
jgi:hypothetical protein